MNEYSKIRYDIIGAAFKVRSNAGRGLLEKFYEAALTFEIKEKGYKVENQVLIPALYRGVEVCDAFRADIIVEDKVIIEVKALPSMLGIHSSQLKTYLRLSDKKLGFLINFGAEEFSTGNLSDIPPYEYGIYPMANGL